MIARISEFVQPWAGWAKKREVEIILGVAVALISLLSFAIGYITAKEQLKEPIRIEESQTNSNG